MYAVLARIAIAGLVLSASPGGRAADAARSDDTVVVTGSKLPQPRATAPAMISVVTAGDMRARGVRDLRGALALVAGVEISPGGDAGPASAVPALWGLREFDAFLLVVDGVPYGGAFNPALATLDLTNVERIEVLRGAAPVSYGATSFVGVIHVIHAAPGATDERASVSAGNHGGRRGSISGDLPGTDSFRHSLTVNGEELGFAQRDADVGRAHLLYRAELDTAHGHWHADVDATHLRQDPYSPHPRDGGDLSLRIPRDANVDPRDARQDQDRAQLNLGYVHDFATTRLAATLAAAGTDNATTRGFLRDGFAVDGTTINADGFRQYSHTNDLWFDLAWSGQLAPAFRWALGADWLYGAAHQRSGNFEYAVLPDGSNRPAATSRHVDEATRLEIERHFAGLYLQADWDVLPRWKLTGGIRLNHTEEDRRGQLVDAAQNVASSDRRTDTRPSGAIGSSYGLVDSSDARLIAFVDWRSTFKPAAADLGPEAESDILRPESAESFEGGLRGDLLGRRLRWEASAFDMEFRNVVIRENVGGLPALANAGRERLRGGEFELALDLTATVRIQGSAAYHDSWFADYARLRPDGSIQQLAGKALELAPQALGALGLVLAPAAGVIGSVVCNYTGSRFLNKSNTAEASGYATLDAGIGWRARHYVLRIDGSNLTDRRDPVAESEIGDAQFYRLPERSVFISLELSR